jgi:hypothetical protein
MAINFPDNPSDGDIATVGGVTYTYTASSNTWKPPVPGASASTLTDLSISDGTAGQLLTTDGNNNFSFTSIASASSTEIFADMAALIAKTGMSAGDQGLVLENNKLFMYTGSAWYLIATMINNSPTAITNVDSTYNLASDGTPTVITAVSTDPEGFPLTWSYAVTSGSLGSTATISQTDNVFTITPGTDVNDAGEFSITFSATDGFNGVVNAISAFTLTTGVSWSLQFPNGGSNNIVTASSSTDFGMGTGDYTLEWWHYQTASGWVLVYDQNYDGDQGLSIWIDPNLAIAPYVNGGTADSTSSNAISLNTWHHIAVVRSGSAVNIYVDGVLKKTSTILAVNIGTMSQPFSIASTYTNNTYQFDGYLSNIRLVKGTAVYTSNFSAPLGDLADIPGTVLLTAQNSTIVDNSSTGHTLTTTGTVTPTQSQVP